MNDGAAHLALNALELQPARRALFTCCGSSRWVDAMLQCRPFISYEQLLSIADELWHAMDGSDYLEAFSHHPKIGADLDELGRKFPSTAGWAASEQAGAASADKSVLHALRDANVEYEQRHGFIFIICASGKSAEEMLQALRARLHNPTAAELRNAAAEQAKITRLRLQKLGATGNAT